MDGGPSIQERESQSSQEVLVYHNEHRNCYYFCCHPLGTGHRFLALFFMCFLGFGSNFCYDTPAALQNHIKHDLNLTTTQYTWLYSIYSWPNIIFCFIGGVLIDRVFGIRLGANIYMGLTMLGHVIFATGAFFSSYYVMLLGRLIFGIGGESLAVAQNNYAVLWFKGKELNTVFGLQMSISRAGSTVNFWVMGHLYNLIKSTDLDKTEILGTTLNLASLTCIFSLICGLILGALDKRCERMVGRTETRPPEQFKLLDIKNFKPSFWFVTVICVSYYVTIYPFISIAKSFFMHTRNTSDNEANFLSSILYIVSGVGSPIFGFLIDLTGRNVAWIFAASFFTALSHVLVGFTDLNPYIGMIMMGLACSMLSSSLWPLVSLIVPEHDLGTAYGVCQSVQNFGLAVIAIVTGVIIDHWGYTVLEEFYLANLAVSIVITICLWIYDKKERGILNMTPANRHARQEMLFASEIEEREKLLGDESTTEYMEPNLDFHIRNRSTLPTT